MSGARNLGEALAATVVAHGSKVALHEREASRTTTYRELQAAVETATRVLSDRWRIAAGDRIAYLGFNRSDELVLLFACARMGAIFVPLNTRLAVNELVDIAMHAGPRVLVTDAAHRAMGVAVVGGARTASGAIAVCTIEELDNQVASSPTPTGAIEGDAPILLVYTSGTSGAPKGALHTQRGLLANVAAAVAAHDLEPDDRVLTVLPLFHVGGLCIQTLPALLTGASVVLHERFDAAAWLHAVATMRPTLSLMVPATLRAVIAHADWADTPLSSLRVLMAGSSIVPRALIDAVHARGVPVGQIYGATETGPVTVALKGGDAMRKAGFAGWPCFADSVRLVDAARHPVRDGEVGEIVVRAPNVMRGYWREPAPGQGGVDSGWFATGDLGCFDSEGCLEVVGRSRDLIISGGENVYPAEVEDVLLAIDGIAEVAVIGQPHAHWGEVPVAFVVRDASIDAPDLDTTIASQLAASLARYKHPKRIVFIDRLPRNAMGKVQGQVLREALATDG